MSCRRQLGMHTRNSHFLSTAGPPAIKATATSVVQDTRFKILPGFVHHSCAAASSAFATSSFIFLAGGQQVHLPDVGCDPCFGPVLTSPTVLRRDPERFVGRCQRMMLHPGLFRPSLPRLKRRPRRPLETNPPVRRLWPSISGPRRSRPHSRET